MSKFVTFGRYYNVAPSLPHPQPSGLYPPCNSSARWHSSLDWTPVTIHSTDRKSDSLMTYWDNCPRLMRCIDEIFEVTEEIKEFQRQHATLLQFIREV